MKVFVSTPHWILNGVCVYIANLVRGLREEGWDAHVLKTGIHRNKRSPEVPFPSDVPVIPFLRNGSWSSRWKDLKCFLESQSPCVYLHNGDWIYAGVTSVLSDGVIAINTVHNRDEEQMEQIERLGGVSNAIMAVSHYLGRLAIHRAPFVEDRVHVIHHGVKTGRLCGKSRAEGEPLRMIYTGRMVQEQKRVLDFPAILEELKKGGVNATLTLVGDGAERKKLRDEFCRRNVLEMVEDRGQLSHWETLDAYGAHDLLLFPSAYEGLSLTVLESMAAGCLPVAAESQPETNEIIKDGVNGCFVHVGDVKGFATAVKFLQERPERRREMQERARATIKNQFSMNMMIQKHIELFEWCDRRRRDGVWKRPMGAIRRPPQLSLRARLGPARVVLGKWKKIAIQTIRLGRQNGQH